MQLGARRRVRAQVIDGPHCGRRAEPRLSCSPATTTSLCPAVSASAWPGAGPPALFPSLRPKGKFILVSWSVSLPTLALLCNIVFSQYYLLLYLRNIVISFSRLNNAAIGHHCSLVFWRTSLVQKNCSLLNVLFYILYNPFSLESLNYNFSNCLACTVTFEGIHLINRLMTRFSRTIWFVAVIWAISYVV